MNRMEDTNYSKVEFGYKAQPKKELQDEDTCGTEIEISGANQRESIPSRTKIVYIRVNFKNRKKH